MKVASLVFVVSPLFLTRSVADAQEPIQGEAVTYFASNNNEAYVDWLETTANTNQISRYTSSVFLLSPDGPENGAAIHWYLNETHIHLAVAARATGWVGFGIADSGSMKGADMVLYTSATNQVTDAYVLDDIYGGPIEDDCQSWKLENSQAEGGFLIFEAVRLLDTQDPQDRPIVNDDESLRIPQSRIIAAWGDSTTVSYHGPTSRARTSIRFYGNNDGDAVTFQRDMEAEAEDFVEVRAKDYQVKPIETEYAKFCFSFADLVAQGMPSNEELHAIGLEPVIDPDSAKYVHHLVVYGEAEDWGTSGEDCDDYFGLNMAYVWAPGEGAFSLPANVGAPIGKNSAFTSFQLEIHYNNPSLDTGMLDSSGVRFYYTRNKRQYDLGVLQLGDPFISLGGRKVSANSDSVATQHVFNCPSTCSQSALLGKEVTVLREYLHMHASGARMYNRQSRNGQVIRTGETDFFDFDSQGNFAVQQVPFTILPGDSFETSCYYNNDGQRREFGLSSQEEMCMAFLFYYPRITLFDIPYTCGYDFFSFCDASWEKQAIESDAELGRAFGAVADVCYQGTDLPPPKTPQPLPNSPPSSPTLPPTKSSGPRFNVPVGMTLLGSVLIVASFLEL